MGLFNLVHQITERAHHGSGVPPSGSFHGSTGGQSGSIHLSPP